MSTMINLSVSIYIDDYDTVNTIIQDTEYMLFPSKILTDYNNKYLILVWDWIKWGLHIDQFFLNLNKNGIEYNITEYGEAGEEYITNDTKLPIIYLSIKFDLDEYVDYNNIIYKNKNSNLISPIEFIKK